MDPVGIKNCKKLFSPPLAFTTQKIATHNTDIISAVCVAFVWVVNASRNEKICLQFLIPTAVFHMLLMSHLHAAMQSRARVCYAVSVVELYALAHAFRSVDVDDGVKSM